MGTFVGILMTGIRLEKMRCFVWLSTVFLSVVLAIVEGDGSVEAGWGPAMGMLPMDRGTIWITFWAANLGMANGFGDLAEVLVDLTANGL